ncbi:hypothetical protein AC579_1206 [Pseudocercospora musae]|uniref:Acyl-CoA thioesterase II n=1 Tax=Pseudocercospora musae TaxID=113226 RepID=A0A139HZN9_9PEZI|nr:hypothetical protein AC579_1206 [Pseudocercospora musae]
MSGTSGTQPFYRNEPSKVTIEQALRLRRIDRDVFENEQEPFTWGGGTMVPGGVLMALAAAAAYETVSTDFAIDMLQAQFLLGPRPTPAMTIRVQRLNDGGRFAFRIVSIEQERSVVCHVTCSFVRPSSLRDPSMAHSVRRATTHEIQSIAIDDLDFGRTDLGPWMRFQRLSITQDGNEQAATDHVAAENLVYTCAAHIEPLMTSTEAKHHALGIIVLSDYHILDCPPHLHGKSLGQARIGDADRCFFPTDFERCTSMNHSIHFHVHREFRADEMTYIEARSPWAGQRRGYIESRIFTRSGLLIATCAQRAYYVLAGISGKEKNKL